MSGTTAALDVKNVEEDDPRLPVIMIQRHENIGDRSAALEIKQVEANERTGADINYPGREQGFDDCSLDRDTESALVG